MWLGEQITERGLGNGISIIIFAGIAAGLPSAIAGTLELVRTGGFGAGLTQLELGGVDYITKPFNPVELASVIRPTPPTVTTMGPRVAVASVGEA